MADSDSTPSRGTDGDADQSTAATPGADGTDEDDIEALREQVEERYDFEDFGPSDMAQMSAEEWEAAFDEETWITGDGLLDRVARDLRRAVANRDVFARIERHRDPQRVLAYSDEGYALVYPDGTVEGHGTVLRDVKPVVALCSMDSYDVPDEVPERPLPDPEAVPEGGGELGNRMLQVVAAGQLLAGLALLGSGVFVVVADGSQGTNVALLFVAGVAFVAIALVLFMTVANARLSDKFRAEEYRDRLRAVGLADGERPEFVPELTPQNDGGDRGDGADGEAGA